MTREPRIKRTPFVKQFGSCRNKYRANDGILLDFETDNGTHYIKLSRETARELARTLDDAEFDWRCGEAIERINLDNQNST